MCSMNIMKIKVVHFEKSLHNFGKTIEILSIFWYNIELTSIVNSKKKGEIIII